MPLKVSTNNFDFVNGEILLIDKPYKWTSFNVVGSVRYYLKHHFDIKKIKVGHAGTLDPLATGLLIICTGKYTKRIEELQTLEKEYTGTIRLGATTPCYDLEKEIDKTFDISYINDEILFKTTKKFIGNIEQTPPIYSALKINGKRAYEYARKNKEVKIKSKLINIKTFDISNIRYSEFVDIDFRVVCSKGTYIRSLARDFGEALNNGAHLTSLRRTKIGNYKLEDAFKIDDLKKYLISNK